MKSHSEFAASAVDPDVVRVAPAPRRLSREQLRAAAFALQDRASDVWNSIQEKLGCILYSHRRKQPFTLGYTEFRNRVVRGAIHDEQVLQTFASAAAQLPSGFGFGLDERVVEYPWLFANLHRHAPGAKMLDAGSTMNHKMLLKHPLAEPHKWSVLTLAPESRCFWRLGISYYFEDLRQLPFRDNWFDAITCLSVMEHIGMDNGHYAGKSDYQEDRPTDYLLAITELRRVLKTGGSLYVTVPFGRYEHLGWLQQFNTEMLDALIAQFSPASLERNFFRYSLRGWQSSTEVECSGEYFSGCLRARHIGRNHNESDCAAAARAVACLRLTK
jgi:SAM-dependent methyltransferase